MGGNSFQIDGTAANTVCNARRAALARAVYEVIVSEMSVVALTVYEVATISGG